MNRLLPYKTKKNLHYLIGIAIAAAVCFSFLYYGLKTTKTFSLISSLFLFCNLVLVLWGFLRLKKGTGENRILKEQLEKSTLILAKQQEKTREIGEKIDSLHGRILMSKQQLEMTFDAITDGICVLDSNFSIQRVNQAYAAMVKTPIRDLLGRKCYHVFWHSKRPCENCPTLETLESGKMNIGRTISRSEGDRFLHYEISSFPIKEDNGNIVNIIETVHDVTEQRMMGDQLIRSEKLATIGIMTAGIAHEINNPLSGISGNISNMLEMPEKYGLNDKGVLRLTSMMEASERATQIMRNLLDLSRRTERQLIFADINEILSNALIRIHLPGYNGIEKEIKTDPKLAPVQCDPAKIEQVFINIFTNAYYAIQEKRERLNRENSGENIGFAGKILIQTFEKGPNALILIEDNGTGIPPDKKKHIFDPFFTTRPPGKGTGLGLSISHKIIAEHGGRIWAQNSNAGAQFFIELPFNRAAHP